MQLKNKNAIIYGAGGAIGNAIALALSKEGAKLFLAGRNKSSLEVTAELIRLNGGDAEIGIVDALDEKAVDKHFKSVVDKVNHVDISVNATGISQKGIQGISLLDLTPEQLLHPIDTYVRSNFVTARAAGRHMTATGKGVIIMLSAPPAKLAASFYGGMPQAWSAIESLNRNFAAELGSSNVRVVCLRSNAMPETGTIKEIFGLHAKGGMTVEQIQGYMESMTLLKHLPTLQQLASTVAFVSSDNAGAITGTTINLSVGAIAD